LPHAEAHLDHRIDEFTGFLAEFANPITPGQRRYMQADACASTLLR
jgi:hypothetical protein